MKKDFFEDSTIKFPAYKPWISNDDKRIVNKTAEAKSFDCSGKSPKKYPEIPKFIEKNSKMFDVFWNV